MQLTVLPFISAFVVNNALASLNVDKESGFDCGPVFFGNYIIKNAGTLVSQNLKKRSSQISLQENDPFRMRNPNHVAWPIRESGQIFGSSRSRESFYILVDQFGRVKDVMARLSNNDFTRCLRKNKRRKSSRLDTTNGYRCGQNFFGDKQLRGDVDEAVSKLGQGLKYPSPYRGNLYLGKEYLTWPILNEKKENTSSWEHSPYHVILSRSGKIIDVIAKLKCNDFIKCERATKLLQIRQMKSSKLLRRAIYAPSDYKCGFQDIFQYDYLSFARTMAITANPRNRAQQSLYPMEYQKFPCQVAACKLWPIFPGGRNYINGNPVGKHFLVMDMKNNIQGVVLQTAVGMVQCAKQPSKKGASIGPNVGTLPGVPQRNGRNEFIAAPGSGPIRPYVPKSAQRN